MFKLIDRCNLEAESKGLTRNLTST